MWTYTEEVRSTRPPSDIVMAMTRDTIELTEYGYCCLFEMGRAFEKVSTCGLVMLLLRSSTKHEFKLKRVRNIKLIEDGINHRVIYHAIRIRQRL